MKNEKLIKVMKTSKTIQLVINIGLIIGWIAVAFAVAMFVIYGVNGGSGGVWLKDMGFEVSEELQSANGLSKGQYMVYWGFIVARLVLLVFAMMKASKVFGNISTKGTPFVKKNTVLIKTIAIFALISCIIPNIETDIEQAVLRISFRWDCALIALVVFLLALVYDYGADLQEQREREAAEKIEANMEEAKDVSDNQ